MACYTYTCVLHLLTVALSIASSWQAHEAQALLKALVASKWRRVLTSKSPLEHSIPKCTRRWVDDAISPGVKGRKRSLEKRDNDYGGHANRLKDLARMTLVYGSCERMERALISKQFDYQHNPLAGGAMAKNGFGIKQLKNNFAHPVSDARTHIAARTHTRSRTHGASPGCAQTSVGYSDINLNVALTLKDGTKYITEMQLNHPAMLAAKEEAHKHYEVARSTIPKVVHARKNASALNRWRSGKAHSSGFGAVVDQARELEDIERRTLATLQQTSLDFTVDTLMSKVISLEDAANLAQQVREMNGLPLPPHSHTPWESS